MDLDNRYHDPDTDRGGQPAGAEGQPGSRPPSTTFSFPSAHIVRPKARFP